MTTHPSPAADVGYGQSGPSYAAAQVFLSYATADLELSFSLQGTGTPASARVIQAVHQLLQKFGFVVVDCQRLRVADSPEDVAISRAIEACDNLLILLSPQSIHHELCLQGLLFAISMNKRIIPVLIETINGEHLPSQLQVLPMIDLRSLTEPIDQSGPGQQLVQTLLHDAAHHQAHKRLLVQALRWERQRRNACLLMRGDCLMQYDQWLQTAHNHPQYPPIRLQALFMEASRAQPARQFWQAHLIYSPADANYARQLSELLQLFGQCTSFDHLNQLMDDKPRQHRQQAIEQSHNCLCILSAEALHSEAFLQELNYGLSLNKQLTVISVAPGVAQALPKELGQYPRLVWPELSTTSAGDFGQLFRLLQHNTVAAAYHTRLLQQTLHWDRHHHDSKLLLNRQHLDDAISWLKSNPNPRPTALQRDYIEASQHQRNRWLGL